MKSCSLQSWLLKKKEEYDAEVALNEGKTRYDNKRMKYLAIKPTGGYLAKAVRVLSWPCESKKCNYVDYVIYVLDDYAVHLMPEVRKAQFQCGYILVIMGGGITGFI